MPTVRRLAAVTRHKYHAQPTEVDGYRFASTKEARRYGELKLLERAGEIHGLTLQPRYELSVDNGDYPEDGRGRSIPLGVYVADFRYFRKGAEGTELVIEDVKGFKTPLYRWKKKHVEAQYGITITEV